jgi:tRNA threonylcarbamoyladenosine biosynthesis protein TsaB
VKILALDTATENCSAALLIDGNVHAREIEMERGHAERILPMIDDLLSQAHISLSDLDAIAFGRGPGSFTGVRLAATVTQGLAFGASLGVVPISNLQAVAQRAFEELAAAESASSGAAAGASDAHAMPPATATKVLAEQPIDTFPPARVLVCNDARMHEVYWGCFERAPDGLARLEGEEHVTKPAEVRLPQAWSTALPAGRGFIAYGAALSTAIPSMTRVPAQASPLTVPSLIHLLPRAIEIALLAAPAVAAGQLLPPESATPIYLRDNVAHVAAQPKPAQ